MRISILPTCSTKFTKLTVLLIHTGDLAQFIPSLYPPLSSLQVSKAPNKTCASVDKYVYLPKTRWWWIAEGGNTRFKQTKTAKRGAASEQGQMISPSKHATIYCYWHRPTNELTKLPHSECSIDISSEPLPGTTIRVLLSSSSQNLYIYRSPDHQRGRCNKLHWQKETHMV